MLRKLLSLFTLLVLAVTALTACAAPAAPVVIPAPEVIVNPPDIVVNVTIPTAEPQTTEVFDYSRFLGAEVSGDLPSTKSDESYSKEEIEAMIAAALAAEAEKEEGSLSNTDPLTTTAFLTETSSIELSALLIPDENMDLYQVMKVVEINGWKITFFPAAFYDRGDGTSYASFISGWDWGLLNPVKWLTPLNEVNPLVASYTTADGIEIVNGESITCATWTECHLPVPPLSYRLYSGDYETPFKVCKGEDGAGCNYSIFNVNSEGDFVVEGIHFSGWTQSGLFFNGDHLYITIPALHSHTTARMTGMTDTGANQGGNCSKSDACDGIDNTGLIVAGSAPLVMIEQIYILP